MLSKDLCRGISFSIIIMPELVYAECENAVKLISDIRLYVNVSGANANVILPAAAHESPHCCLGISTEGKVIIAPSAFGSYWQSRQRAIAASAACQ